MTAVDGLAKLRSRTDPAMISAWVELALGLRDHDRGREALRYFRWQVATMWAVADSIE